MARVRRLRFRLATLFTFAFGFAVGLMWNEYMNSFLAGLVRTKPSAPSVVYTGGSLAAAELPLSPGMSVMQVISGLGGLGDLAGKSEVTIVRRSEDGSYSEIVLDITKPSDANSLLQPGDQVVVQEAPP